MGIRKPRPTPKVINKVGHPKSFKEPKELMEKANSYLKKCMIKKIVGFDEGEIVNRDCYVIASIVGFANHCGVSRETIYEYGRKEEYSDTIKRIDNLFEEHNTIGVSNGDIKTAFGIFYFKNKHGYVDKTETTNHNINKNIETNQMSDEELEEVINGETIGIEATSTRGTGEKKNP